jgi:hypothetical protein
LEPIEAIKNEALIVLDANVLLLPFTTDVKNVEVIKDVYQRLVESDQIFLPAQAIREYLDNRAKKLADINESLQKKSTQSFNFVGAHPLLGGLDQYQDVINLETNLKESIKNYQNKIRETLEAVQAWGWNDPVSKMYHEVLSERVLSDDALEMDNITKDLERRNTLNIPPGYKDKNKEQNQAGDLLIWHELLNLAENKGQHVIFVSGDEKADWWHQSGRNPLYPRFELVDEFREKTGGKSFHILSLSKLLKLYNAEDDVVESVKYSEKGARISSGRYSTSNNELYVRAMSIVKELRNIISLEREESERLSSLRMSEMRNAPEVDKAVIWDKFNNLEREPTRRLMSQYDNNFKIDASILRDEIIKRLPEALILKNDQHSISMYDHPTNPLGLIEVVDNLEYHAKLLPKEI